MFFHDVPYFVTNKSETQRLTHDELQIEIPGLKIRHPFPKIQQKCNDQNSCNCPTNSVTLKNLLKKLPCDTQSVHECI